MDKNIIKETIPFTFDEIYKDLELKFSKKGYDAPYEGSNLAQLITAMSYVVSSLNLNTAVNINESILPLARKRKNVIQDARLLSYEPRYRSSYSFNITLKFKSLGTFTIPRYSNFTINGSNFVYMGEDIVINVTDIDNNYVTLNVKEGKIIKHSEFPEILEYSLNKEYNYIDIPFDDVEDDGLRITATYYDDFGDFINEKLLEKNDFSILDKNNDYNYKYFRKDDLKTGNCRVFFKLNGLGTDFPQGTIIKVDVLKSNGSIGFNNSEIESIIPDKEVQKFATPILIGNLSPKLIKSGNDGETIESIKENAPLFYNSASRVVNVHDYKSVANSHIAVENSQVWGGEDEVPVKLGHIFYSFVPERERDKYNILTKKGNTFRIDGDSEDSRINSDRYYYSLSDYNKTDKLFLKDNEFFSVDVIDKTILNKGVLDLINSYSLPSLKDNIRNPIYFYADLFVNIKKYPFGTPTFETRQKIFDGIKEYFEKNKKFDSNYTHSNLVRYLDNILGINNGIEIYPKFKILIKKENISKVLEQDEKFNTLNAFYKESYKNNKLIVLIYLAETSKEGDIISLTLSKNLEGTNIKRHTINKQEEKNGLVELMFENNKLLDEFFVKFRSFDGLSSLEGKDVNLYNFANKKIFFSTKIKSQSAEIKIRLPRFVRTNDGIEIYGLYGKNKYEFKLTDLIIKDMDIENGYISYIDINRANFAGIVNPEDYVIKYKSQNNPKILNGEVVLDDNSAKEKILEQDNNFSNLEINDLYFNYFRKDNKVNIRIWVPKFAKINDVITISTYYNNQEIILTEDLINKGVFDIDFELSDLKVLNARYDGLDKNIKIFPIKLKNKNIIKEDEDDSLRFDTKKLENKIEYKPLTTYDRIMKFKENIEIEFFTHFYNEFDIRNLIQNYDDSTQISINIPDELKLENNKIICEYPIQPKTLSFEATYIYNNETFSKNFLIKMKETKKDIYNKEGSGGIYIYLDLPLENIYESNRLMINRLPKIEFENEESKIYIDFTINKDNAKNIFPYNVVEEQLDSLKHSELEYIKFPIYFTEKNLVKPVTEIVGTYTIFNSRIPYIRIKFLKELCREDYKDDYLLDLKYPTNNINFIRNSYIKLRNVSFDTFEEIIEN